MFAPIRDGNRGGRGLFSWEEVRAMSYRDRECYLGNTASLGYLDKGGRWRKRDWWARDEKPEDNKIGNTEEVRKQDMDNIRAALGFSDKKTKKKIELSDREKSELLKKEGTKKNDIRTEGLGYHKKPEPEPEEKVKEEGERKSLYKKYKRHKKNRKDKF